MVTYEYLLRKFYGRYKWQWCKDRGCKPEDVDEGIGINGECFVCIEEFENNEFQDKEYMRNLLCDEEFKWWEIRDKLEKTKPERTKKSIDLDWIAAALDMTLHQASEVVRIFDELKRQYDEGDLAYCFIRSNLETTNDYITEWEDHWHREESVEAFWEDEKDNYRSDYEDLSVLETLESFLEYWKNNFYEVRGEKMIFVVM